MDRRTLGSHMLVVQLLGACVAGRQRIVNLGLLQLVELWCTESNQHRQIRPRQHREDLAQLADHNQRHHHLQMRLNRTVLQVAGSGCNGCSQNDHSTVEYAQQHLGSQNCVTSSADPVEQSCKQQTAFVKCMVLAKHAMARTFTVVNVLSSNSCRALQLTCNMHSPRALFTIGTYESTSCLAWLSEMPSLSSLGTGGPGLQQWAPAI